MWRNRNFIIIARQNLRYHFCLSGCVSGVLVLCLNKCTNHHTCGTFERSITQLYKPGFRYKIPKRNPISMDDKCAPDVKQETQSSLTNCATQLHGDLKRPSQCALPCRIWSFCVKGCRHKYRRTTKLGSAGTLLSWDGRRGWPHDTRPTPTCVTTFSEKGCMYKQKGTHICGALGHCNLEMECEWDLKQAHSPYVLSRQIW